MKGIDDVVAVVKGWSRERSADRDRIAECLGSLASNCEEAITVWQDYLGNPGSGGDHWTPISWVGAERAKRLYEIHLSSVDTLRTLLATAGPETARSRAYEDSLIEMAFRQFRTDETASDMAQAAIEHMATNRRYLSLVADRIKSIVLSEPRKTAKTAKTAKRAASREAKSPALAVKARSAVAKKAVKKKAAKKPAGKKSMPRSKGRAGRTRRR